LTTGSVSEPAVSLVVVCFDGERTIRACLESLLADGEPAREIFVVDNASSDGSRDVIEALAREHPALHVVCSDENLGYAGAVNRVLPACRGRYVGVLNMDLVAEPGWLAPLVAFLDHHPGVGAVNPLLALQDGDTLNALGQAVHVTGLGFNRGLGDARAEVTPDAIAVSGIQGAAFLVRRGLLDEMGGLDASGFLYHEDVNLSWLLRMMGHELYCVPTSAVRHDYSLSMHAEKLFLLERNRIDMLLTHLRPLTGLALAPMLALTETMIWGYALLRGRSFLHAKLRSYRWLWRTRGERRARRRRVQALRVRSDAEVLRSLHWRYAWRQLRTLAGERGAPRRHFGTGSRADRDAA
jgi:GT2 family glycosyltransferase